MFDVYLKPSDRNCFKTYIDFRMNGNNESLVLQQRKSRFISVYDHLQKSENTMTGMKESSLHTVIEYKSSSKEKQMSYTFSKRRESFEI